MFEVYIKKKAVEQAENYFSQLAAGRLEGMGFLLGNEYEDDGKRFVLISDFVTSETVSSPVSVRFSHNAFQSLSQQLKEKLGDAVIIGWCHSHPSYGCFLSSTDINTQARFFSEGFHVASVFDPLSKEQFGEKQAMSKRFYRLNGNLYKEVSFAVIK